MFAGKAQFSIKFFGWYNDPAENSDKIWGWVEVEGKLYNFWGRRADLGEKKRLKFKRHSAPWGAQALQEKTRKKRRKGYQTIDLQQDDNGNYPGIEAVYPGFGARFKDQLMFARLTGTVKNETV